MDLNSNGIKLFSIEEYSQNGQVVETLEKKIWALKDKKKAEEIKTFLELNKELKDVTILLIDNHDYGEKSPFTISRINFYVLKPG